MKKIINHKGKAALGVSTKHTFTLNEKTDILLMLYYLCGLNKVDLADEDGPLIIKRGFSIRDPQNMEAIVDEIYNMQDLFGVYPTDKIMLIECSVDKQETPLLDDGLWLFNCTGFTDTIFKLGHQILCFMDGFDKGYVAYYVINPVSFIDGSILSFENKTFPEKEKMNAFLTIDYNKLVDDVRAEKRRHNEDSYTLE